MVLLGLGIHFVPLLAKRLAEGDARRREELIAKGIIVATGEDDRND
jgi:hypothetical protein